LRQRTPSRKILSSSPDVGFPIDFVWYLLTLGQRCCHDDDQTTPIPGAATGDPDMDLTRFLPPADAPSHVNGAMRSDPTTLAGWMSRLHPIVAPRPAR
jgi:hypothetical protein